jgi:diadenosine tetraphosphatase ApaH/serine/threonine PP2A family protein phosphatase
LGNLAPVLAFEPIADGVFQFLRKITLSDHLPHEGKRYRAVWQDLDGPLQPFFTPDVNLELVSWVDSVARNWSRGPLWCPLGNQANWRE